MTHIVSTIHIVSRIVIINFCQQIKNADFYGLLRKNNAKIDNVHNE